MKVAIDATPLLGDRTGVGVAVTGMITALAGRTADVSVIGYGLTTMGWHRLRGVLPAGVPASRAPMPASALLRVWSRIDRPPVEWWSGHVDVVHGTNFVVPPALGAGRIVSVWDMTAVRYPEMCTPTARRYPALIARSIDHGAFVHTGSQYVAAEIVDHFGVDPARVRVVPPGIDSPSIPGIPESRPPDTRAPYIVSLGTTEPRKDFPGLVVAFERIASSHPDLELRIAGPAGWAEEQLLNRIDASPYKDRVHRMGWVPDVQRLVAGAAVFAYPSLYEGFGFPPLEAMSLGVPVIATSAGAVPEVVGDAAVLVPPGDPDALASAFENVLDDDDLRQRLVTSGLGRVATFTWEDAATGLIGAYRDVAGDRDRPPRRTARRTD